MSRDNSIGDSQSSAIISRPDTINTLKPVQSEYNYASLDHSKSSIRLIQILPELSTEGYLQCRIRHTIIGPSVKYKCLSYVWGPPHPEGWIFLDGQRHSVRHNLWSFLVSAWLNHYEAWFWIDALCIDQANDDERVHQVQQMGQIYLNADEVVSWLGYNKEIAFYLDRVRNHKPSNEDPLEDKAGLTAFLLSDYWDRAWITQEVTLARTVTLMYGLKSLPLRLLPWNIYAITAFNAFADIDLRDRLERLRKFKPGESQTDRDKSLLYLLWINRDRKCAFPRDRIFSLLAICGDNPNLKIDYTTPSEQLALETLRGCKHSFCLCSLRIVGDVLQIDNTSASDCSERDFDIARCTLPVLTGRNRQCSCRPPTTSHCRRWKHTPTMLTGWRHSPSIFQRRRRNWRFQHTSTLIKFDLSQLCSAYAGTITIKTYPGRLGFTYKSTLDKYSAALFKRSDTTTRDRVDGVRMDFSPDRKNCTLTFSLHFLLEIARSRAPNSWPPCLDVHGKRSTWELEKQSLQIL